MISVKIAGQSLDLSTDTRLELEMQNTVFASADLGSLPGSYSLPFSAPATPRNRQILGYTDRLDAAAPLPRDLDFEFFYESKMLFRGKAKVEKATPAAFELSAVSDTITFSKDLKLSDLDLGGDRIIGDWAAHMKDTARFPDNYDYVFFPVSQNKTSAGNELFINIFFVAGGNFTTGGTSSIIAPFTRIEYLLNRLFEGATYSFVNGWQRDTESKRIVMLATRDARVAAFPTSNPPVLPGSFRLNDFLPEMTGAEFLKKICAHFCLGFFTDFNSRTLRLLPISNLLDTPPAKNWTAYAIAPHQIEAPDDAPEFYSFPDSDASFPADTNPETVAHFNTLLDALNASVNGYAYIEQPNQLMLFANGLPQKSWKVYRGVGNRKGTAWESGVEGLREFINAFDGNYYRYEGEVFVWANTGIGTPYERSDARPPLVLMLYRGWQQQDPATAQPVPTASHHVWNTYSNTPATRKPITEDGVTLAASTLSLNWHGQYGLYEKYHRRWHHMLSRGKHVSMDFVLPLHELASFRFDQKIRVQNMDFFVRTLRPSFSRGEKIRVKADLISTA